MRIRPRIYRTGAPQYRHERPRRRRVCIWPLPSLAAMLLALALAATYPARTHESVVWLPAQTAAAHPRAAAQ